MPTIPLKQNCDSNHFWFVNFLIVSHYPKSEQEISAGFEFGDPFPAGANFWATTKERPKKFACDDIYFHTWFT